MIFSSSVFLLVFLPISLLIYYVVRIELKNVILLLLSLIFYAWGEPRTVVILVFLSIIDYVIALLITGCKSSWIRSVILGIAVCINLGVLFYYKYYDFTVNNINLIFKTTFLASNRALPIGISFFTFQAMSYVFDVYKEEVDVQKNPINVLLYVALFPQLIAGPIVRYKDINEQINLRHIDWIKFEGGMSRFIVGLSKKVLIADNFAVMVDRIFASNISTMPVGTLWLGAIFYTFQIYYDFSGYSDMAIGLGKLFGFDFNENFDYPYTSKSISEFWRRWHISLSSWFRDYIYIPLGGSKKGNVYVHLGIVFFITGIWHGASWNFILWGAWHGFFVIIERFLKKHNINWPIFKGHIYTLIVVILGWVLFRCETLGKCLSYIKGMFLLNQNVFFDNNTIFYFKENIVSMIIACVCSCSVISVSYTKLNEYVWGNRLLYVLKPFVIIFLFCFSFSCIISNDYNPFLYFNF